MRNYTRKKSYRHMNQEKADEMRRLYFSRTMKQKELAVHFRVSIATVSRIISGFTWSEVK